MVPDDGPARDVHGRWPTATVTGGLLTGDLLTAIGAFLGGAVPWLEAVVVIPAAILAGLDPTVAVVAGVTGNLTTVAAAAWGGERVNAWWRRRRTVDPADEGGSPPPNRRRARVERVVARYGLPGLAVIGPLAIGTQLSALVAVGLGVDARRAFLWVAAGTVAWAIVAAVATVGGASFLGVGAT